MNRKLIAALALSASPFVFASAIAQATQTTDAAAPQPDVTDQTQEVVVTGSRAANRTVADSPVPIDVISSESLTTNGTGETNKILNQLVPSFNFPQPSIADGSDVIRPATQFQAAIRQAVDLVDESPDRIVASHLTDGKVDRTRPLCAFPKVAKWNGSGSTDDAMNFSCAADTAVKGTK